MNQNIRKKRAYAKRVNASKKTRMRVNTYAKRLISIYELSFCLSFVALSLFSLNRLRCGECENNLRVLWSVRKKSHRIACVHFASALFAYLRAALYLFICLTHPISGELFKYPVSIVIFVIILCFLYIFTL